MSETRTPMQIKKELRAKVKELKPFLPRGTAQEVAKKLNCKADHVYDVIGARRWDLEVIEEIAKIGEANLKRALKAEKTIDKILDQNGKTTQG